MPFTKFNVGWIQGTYEIDAKGNPILKKGKKKDEFYDSDGNKVNKKGYLVDENGNIIDRWGDLVFKKFLLGKDGDIPIVFWNGLLRKGSASSLSRLMSEIEKDNGDSDIDGHIN